jgi:hypothetical protein
MQNADDDSMEDDGDDNMEVDDNVNDDGDDDGDDDDGSSSSASTTSSTSMASSSISIASSSTSTSSTSTTSSSSYLSSGGMLPVDEDNEDDFAVQINEAETMQWVFQANRAIAQYVMTMGMGRLQPNVYIRFNITEFLLSRVDDPLHHRRTRMDFPSFMNLVDLLRDKLKVNIPQAERRGGPITPEACVYCTLRYLAGSSYICISDFVGISTSAFYTILHRTLNATLECEALALHFPTSVEDCIKLSEEFGDISYKRAIQNCVGAVDGYVLAIKTPPAELVGNVKAYFSGQYQRMAINVQAAVDSHCRFLYFAMCAPGSAHDSIAFMSADENGVSLHD